MNWSDGATVEAFHRGERAALEAVYRAHFDDVSRAVARLLRGVDHENVVHEVFAKLVEDRATRERFTGGSMAAWLVTIARNRAFDLLARQGREVPADEAFDHVGPSFEAQLAARDLLKRFRATIEPKWQPVFDACFLERLDQRSAAQKLGMARTTLAYQWWRIKRLLERFVVEGGG
jgi:RNA polymerase sigma factor (sigma-70 family)